MTDPPFVDQGQERGEPPWDRPWLYWCKTVDGSLVEHLANPYEGHRKHVRCQPIEPVTPKSEGRDE